MRKFCIIRSVSKLNLIAFPSVVFCSFLARWMSSEWAVSDLRVLRFGTFQSVMSSFQTYKVIGNRTVAANSFSIGSPISNSGSYHTEVNTMLAGSMMISLSFLVIGLCFFLHRKLKKEPGPVTLHTLPWTDENLEIFTLSGQEEVTGIYLPQPTPSPPPSYELVVKIRDKEEESCVEKACSTQSKEEKITIDDEDLPSYDAAMKLGAHGYL